MALTGIKNGAAGLRLRPTRIREFFANLGPGLITGAADDDPSGISTYSVTGAAFGYGPLWTAIFSFPLMLSVQLMCARLGMVTGRGLAGVVRRRYARWVLWSACGLLAVANVFNIGADLAGMAVVNGVLAPPLVALVVLLTSDSSVMGTRRNPLWLRCLGWTTAAVMALAAVGLLVTSVV